MVIINFANKWEIIIIIRDKKNRDKFFVRWKKIGEKYWSGKRKSGKNFVTCKKFSHFSPTFFSPIRYQNTFLLNQNKFIFNKMYSDYSTVFLWYQIYFYSIQINLYSVRNSFIIYIFFVQVKYILFMWILHSILFQYFCSTTMWKIC